MISIKQVGDWSTAARIARTMQKRFVRALEVAVMQEAQVMRGHIVKGIAQQAPGGRAFQPISPLTRALRKLNGGGGIKALIATGGLRGAITVQKMPGSSSTNPKAFVGLLRAAKGKGGKSLANIGIIHEYGANITRTAKMNRFLHAMARRAGLSAGGGGLSIGGGAGGKVFKDKTGRWRNSSGRFLSGNQLAAAKAAEAGAKQDAKAAKGGAKGRQGTIRIPPRPFIGPVLDTYAKPADVKRRFYQRIARSMDGDLGKVSGGGLGVT